ncbi:DndE family protein [Thermoactinomyces sp. CICC 10521]|uniref:DndE family protein n=1 Tax=Thermoactinomyces sp. CICC 10521 TaxID=2767426 RepID=UPI0018DCB694|nr:DndE family protein [Thermoactinomyces sp. CICC 10521]MBH8608230.1 DndE family protein [Thermoactinomyces sp. CICC 10521]
MNYRLKTSKKVEKELKEAQRVLNYTPNLIVRIAVALSLRIPEPIEVKNTDHLGQEFNRNTLTGEYDYIFKAMIAHHLGREVSDEEYFPDLFNAHLERGLTILANEYKMAGNAEKFFRTLIQMGEE